MLFLGLLLNKIAYFNSSETPIAKAEGTELGRNMSRIGTEYETENVLPTVFAGPAFHSAVLRVSLPVTVVPWWRYHTSLSNGCTHLLCCSEISVGTQCIKRYFNFLTDFKNYSCVSIVNLFKIPDNVFLPPAPTICELHPVSLAAFSSVTPKA